MLNAYYVLMELILVVEKQGVTGALNLKKKLGKKEIYFSKINLF